MNVADFLPFWLLNGRVGLIITLSMLLSESTLAHIGARAECLNHLRCLDLAKETLALERKLNPGDVVEPASLRDYFPNKTRPRCAAGGDYTLGPIGVYPVCSIPGHSQAAWERDVARRARQERLLVWLLVAVGGLAAVAAVWATRAGLARPAEKRHTPTHE